MKPFLRIELVTLMMMLPIVTIAQPTVKIPQIQQVWAARWDTVGNASEKAAAVAVDDNGCIYVAGTDDPAGTDGGDFAVVKYSPCGTRLWVSTYNFGIWDEVTAMAVDADGNVYVAGEVNSGLGDYGVVKFESDSGNVVWHITWTGAYGEDRPTAIAVDQLGWVYVTGYTKSTVAEGLNYATLWISPYGRLARVCLYHYQDGPATNINADIAMDIAVDAEGYAYVTGTSWSATTDYRDIATIKYVPGWVYTPAEDTVWVRRWSGPYGDQANALVLDEDGNVYVTGYRTGYTEQDYVTLKYDTDGHLLWNQFYDGPGHGTDEAYAIALDASRNVYVTGYSDGATGASYNPDYATVKYNTDGDFQWVWRYDSPVVSNGYDYATAIVVDPQNRIWVTGRSQGSGMPGYYEPTDYTTIYYTPTGNPLVTRRYDGSNGDDRATGIACDQQCNIYVTGYSDGQAGTITDYDFTTIKYGSLAVAWPDELSSGGEKLQAVSSSVALHCNDPNPYNAITAISFTLNEAQSVSLSVHDVAGRFIATLANGWRQAGNHVVTFDGSGLASGVYLYRLAAGKYSATRKMILLK